MFCPGKRLRLVMRNSHQLYEDRHLFGVASPTSNTAVSRIRVGSNFEQWSTQTSDLVQKSALPCFIAHTRCPYKMRAKLTYLPPDVAISEVPESSTMLAADVLGVHLMPSAVRPPEVDVEAPATLKGQWQAGAGTVPELGVSACVYERKKINVVKNLKAFVRNGTFLKKCTILKMFVCARPALKPDQPLRPR